MKPRRNAVCRERHEGVGFDHVPEYGVAELQGPFVPGRRSRRCIAQGVPDDILMDVFVVDALDESTHHRQWLNLLERHEHAFLRGRVNREGESEHVEHVAKSLAALAFVGHHGECPQQLVMVSLYQLV
jgi:hypothetical protein